MTVDRETLYKEVWAEPMTKVAARYAVSSSFLARECERLNVPKPARATGKLLSTTTPRLATATSWRRARMEPPPFYSVRLRRTNRSKDQVFVGRERLQAKSPSKRPERQSEGSY